LPAFLYPTIPEDFIMKQELNPAEQTNMNTVNCTTNEEPRQSGACNFEIASYNGLMTSAPETKQASASNYTLQVASRIRAARAERDITQDTLSDLIGFNDRQTLSAIETGERALASKELVKIAAILGKPLDYFTDPYVVTEPKAFSYRAKSNSEELKTFETSAHKLISADRRFRQLLGEVGVPYSPKITNLTKQSPLLLAAKCGDDTARSLKLGNPPADSLKEAAEAQLRINVLHVDAPPSISGAACHLPDGNYVLINRREPSYRRNFNLGHEIFHIMTWDTMPPERLDLISFGEERPKTEKLADNFSSGLLLPADQVLTRWHQKPEILSNEEWLVALGKEFRVSGESVYWRLTNLGTKPKVDNLSALARYDEKAGDGVPLIYNDEFIRRLHSVLSRGLVSVRKAASVLGCEPEELTAMVETYGLDASF
jgi:Zn-dependent peptidase ImmA (M78 family)/transcriptional regulator with XRE-family HTH domain